MGYGDVTINRKGTDLFLSYYNSNWLVQQSGGFYFKLRAYGTDFIVPIFFGNTGGKIDALSIPFEPKLIKWITFAKR